MTKKVSKEQFITLTIGAIGVVYGDIGTSPLYALKTCLLLSGLPVSEPVILGIISLFIWSIILVVSFKYVRLVLTLDHNGEGGVLALSTLAAAAGDHKYKSSALILGILGTSLFFGDGIIMPAISVLSAIEGISLINHDLTPYILPLTLIVISFLFAIQRYGSGRIGQFFGPLMILWFSVLFALGLYQIATYPFILNALNPYYALHFMYTYAWLAAAVMGGVILVVTGAEALYADLGHFGRQPIKVSWTYFVFPALISNYLGQGALLLTTPEAVTNPFYLMAPSWALHPLIFLATIATIIASQSIISGLFSLSWQMVLLNYLPRMKVTNTSEETIGQVYLSTINRILYVLTIGAVLKFGSSENLAAAYGLCVAGIMMITTTLVFMIAQEKWKWSPLKMALIFVPFYSLDLLFISTNLFKFFDGAWYVILITGATYFIIHTWIQGNKALHSQKHVVHMSAADFIENHLDAYPQRMPGTALFLNREPYRIPSSLVMQLKHNKYMHDQIILVSLVSKDVPYQSVNKRFICEPITDNCSQLIVNFGFKEIPDIGKALHWLKSHEIIKSERTVSIFLGKGIPVRSSAKFLSGISEGLYITMASLAQNTSDFYRIPHHKVVEIGIRYTI